VITAWRIHKPRHAAVAFTGEGARLYGGRFNSKGTAVVYTSSSASLAMLEMLVHMQSSDLLLQYLVRSVTFNDAMVRRIEVEKLPTDWRENPPPADLQRIGDEWAARLESAVLEVPSVIVEGESNFLLNPQHPDFPRIAIGPEQPLRFDPRLAH
jgi:RES domain-containing protein